MNSMYEYMLFYIGTHVDITQGGTQGGRRKRSPAQYVTEVSLQLSGRNAYIHMSFCNIRLEESL
jgi:hypothetical protein